MTPPQASGLANPNANSGIYSRFLSEEDQAIYAEAVLGNVDHELRLMRLRLARTVKARKAWEDALAAPTRGDGEDQHVLVEVVDDQSLSKDGDVYDLTKRVKRLPDFDKIEQACLARIESLEKTRRELLKSPDDDGDTEPGSVRLTITGGLPSRGG